MFGWIVTDLNLENEIAGEYEKILVNDKVFARKHNGRFKNDAIFLDHENYVIILDGIITNKSELMMESNDELWHECIIGLFEKFGNKMPDKLRGQFSGCIYNKINDELFFFTNHIGDGGVFYRVDKNNIIISNNFNWIVNLLKSNRIEYNLCEDAVKFMCTFGFMLNNVTYVERVFKLLPSEYGVLKDKVLHIDKFHIFTNTNTVDEKEEIIVEKLDFLFRQAIKRGFDKDSEYGYKSVADLSGGLDARMVNFVAKDMGYKMTNISFSQKNSDEYKAMIKLNKALGNELIYLQLDDAPHIYLVDKIVSLNYGLSFFAGAGGLVNILENLDLNYYGIEHGGVMGEMAEGVFPGKEYKEHTKPTLKNGMAFGKTISMDILDEKLVNSFENTEMFQVFGRGMMGGALPQLIRRQYTGYLSPFEDVDFYDYFLSIPLHIRGEKQILRKWANEKYPEAFDIIEDKLMCKPNASEFIRSIMLFKRKVKGKLVQYFNIDYFRKNNMNPMEYWYDTNEHLRNFIDEYFEKNIYRLENNKYVYKIVKQMFDEGEIKEKLIVMTILSVMKQYF